MGTFQTLIARLIAGDAMRAKVKANAARSLGRRSPSCEPLEGRQLLNGSWAQGGWQAHPGAISAHVHRPGRIAGGHAAAAGLGRAKGKGAGAGHDLASAGPQVQADLVALQADTKALQAEVPADLTAKVRADRTMIEEAHATLAPGSFNAPTAWQAPTPDTFSSNQSGRISTMLRNSGASDQEINALIADFKTYKKTIDSLDPALHAKIAADKAALAKDLGPGHRADLNAAAGTGLL
jgi:hypothetical protein